jgi:GntR family transcriptional repressor for pyruvate dehydrogenase complex
MFKSIKHIKISENISRQIRKAILGGKLIPGDKLPSENQLIKKFRVSKLTLREALRNLESLGLIETRKGKSGGIFITEVDMEKAKESFSNFLFFKNFNLKNLIEIGFILEPYVVAKAANAIDQEGLERLGNLIEESDNILKRNISIRIQKNEIEFDHIIRGSTRNPILFFILYFIESLLLEAKKVLHTNKQFSTRVLNSHKRIYEALVERDVEKARNETIKHLREVEKNLLTLTKGNKVKGLNLR